MLYKYCLKIIYPLPSDASYRIKIVKLTCDITACINVVMKVNEAKKIT